MARPQFIPAYKHGWPALAVDALIRRKMAQSLFQVRAQGLDRLRESIGREPGGTLFAANHSCWWDLFLAHFLNESVPVDGYGMMLHANMLRFGFFRRIGAFSVDRADPMAVRASIDYAAGLLRGPRAGVWIFPQGTMIGNDVRPLGFRPGLRPLVRRAGRVRIVPTAIRYEFWQDERPEAFVRFGEPCWVEKAEAGSVVEDCERRVAAELDALKLDVTGQDAGRFVSLMVGRGSVSDRYARFRAALTRGDDPR